MANLAPTTPIESDLKVGPVIGESLRPTYESILGSSPITANKTAFDAGASLFPGTPKQAKVASTAALMKPADWIRPLLVSAKTSANAASGGTPRISDSPGSGSPGIAKNALRYLGTPYVWGGAAPGGFDCSGLLQYAAAQAGIHISRTTYTQWKEGRPVGLSQLRAGDAVFFMGSDSVNGLPGHVGIYIGNGQFIEAAHTGAPVRISRLTGYPGYMGARRYG